MKCALRLCLTGMLLSAVPLSMLVQAQELKRVSFEQIFKGAEPRLVSSLPTVTGWADEGHYLITRKRGGQTFSVDVASGKETLSRDFDQFKDVVGQGVNPALPVSATKAYDKLIYVKDNDLYLLVPGTKEFTRLTSTASEEKNPTLSPDGKYVAFTRDNNLFAVDISTRKEMQFTADGSDVVYNGWASWVYYEEILGRASRYRAFWWSPDSRHIAFYRFDDTHVPVFPLLDAEGVHISCENTRYPAAGDPNPTVRVGIVGVDGGSVWAGFREQDDQYFGMPFWTPDGKRLFVQWMNRQQDTLKIYSVDAVRGERKEIYLEHQPSWVDWFESIEFLKNGEGFVVKSDRDGWSHLYLYDMDGTLRNRITEGKWAVTGVQGISEDAGMIYFTAKKEASTRTDLYRAPLDGKSLTRLTFGNYSHTVKVSPLGSHFVTSYSNLLTPPRLALCDAKGTVVRDLGDSKAKEFAEYAVARPELQRVKTSDGFDLPVTVMLPVPFSPGKKYPVIISVYGGPDAGTVSDTWQGIGNQWLAQEGAIQVSIDHRGSGHFGKEGAALMYRNLGKWEMHDYGEVAQWLRAKPYVDTSRICITGGSYGGYVTCLALTQDAEYFTHGIAEFSVTDWKLYDSHYVERFMDTPSDNPEGYRNGSVMAHAAKYRGMLKIVHGMMDDNVHMQNSIQLIDTLETLGKHFEFILYPDGRHGWGGPKATHLRNENYRFYYRYLLGKEFPENLFR